VDGVRDHGGRRRIAIAEAGDREGGEVTGKERGEKGKVEMVLWVLLLFRPWVDRY
jgi:hypothetical protein